MRTSLGEWSFLDEDERQRLGELVAELLAGKSWEAARGFTLTDEMCTVIAAQAALVVLGLDLETYREVRAVIVHPTTVTSRRPRPGPVAGVVTEEPLDLLGEAHRQRGPVLLAWDTAWGDARHAGTGRNVVIHLDTVEVTRSSRAVPTERARATPFCLGLLPLDRLSGCGAHVRRHQRGPVEVARRCAWAGPDAN